MLHELREHQLPLVHRSTLRNAASQGRRTKIRNSNRDQEKSELMRFHSTTYKAQKSKRWDSTDLVTDLSEPLDQIYDSNLFPGLVVDAGKV
jgi:hypothetical protein